MQALARVGIAEQALKRGSELSGGQQQRAAIASTLVQGASVLIADEPIASLDPKAARRVMDILAELNRQDKITVLVSLHQVEYALAYCPRTIALRDGRIVYDGPSKRADAGLPERAVRRRERGAVPAGASAAAAGEVANGHAHDVRRPRAELDRRRSGGGARLSRPAGTLSRATARVTLSEN